MGVGIRMIPKASDCMELREYETGRASSVIEGWTSRKAMAKFDTVPGFLITPLLLLVHDHTAKAPPYGEVPWEIIVIYFRATFES